MQAGSDMSDQQPNIVFFFWDNLGWGEPGGCHGDRPGPNCRPEETDPVPPTRGETDPVPGHGWCGDHAAMLAAL